MAHVLLLFLSTWNKSSGLPQTNTTAVRHLFKEGDPPDTIIALCSEAVRATPDEGGPSTLAYFRDEFLPPLYGESPAETQKRFVEIPVPNSLNDRARLAAVKAVTEHMAAARQADLTIDLTGGMRDTIMLLVTIARYLQDIVDLHRCRVLYTEYPKKGDDSPPVTQDATRLYDLLDLVSATDLFFETGSAQKLLAFCNRVQLLQGSGRRGGSVDQTRQILNTVGSFSHHLALCQTGGLRDDLRELQQLLAAPAAGGADTLEQLLLQMLGQWLQTEFQPLFRQKKPADSLAPLVHWCRRHGLYQQALTLLTEGFPAYFCNRVLLQPTDEMLRRMSLNKSAGQLWVYSLFHFYCSRLAQPQQDGRAYTLRALRVQGDPELVRVPTDDQIKAYLRTCRNDGLLLYNDDDLSLLTTGIRLYSSVLQLRNQINHASEQAARSGVDGVLAVTHENVAGILDEACKHLDAIATRTPTLPPGVTLRRVTERVPVPNA